MSSYNTGIGTIHTLLTIFSSNHFWVRIHFEDNFEDRWPRHKFERHSGLWSLQYTSKFLSIERLKSFREKLGYYLRVTWNHLRSPHGSYGVFFRWSLQHLDRQEVGHAHLPEDKKMSLTGACYLRELSGKCWQNWSLHALSIVSLSSFKLVFLPCQKHSRASVSSFTQSNSFRSRIHG